MAGFKPRNTAIRQGLSPGQKTTLNRNAMGILDPKAVLDSSQPLPNLGTTPQLTPGLTGTSPQPSGQTPPAAPAAGPRVPTPQDVGQLWGQSKQAIYPGSSPDLRTQVPNLQAPSLPNPQVEQQARQRSQLADLVHGFTGSIPLTSYSAKLGQTPGMVAQSPAWDAVKGQAQNPWALEQRQVNNANIMHAFANQYSKMKTDADNADNQHAFEVAQGLSATAGAIGIFGAQKDLAERSLGVEQEKARAMSSLAGRRLDLADERLRLAEQNADKGYLPGRADSIAYQMTKTVGPMIERLRDLIQKDGALNPDHLSWTFGQHRLSSDATSQEIQSLRSGIHQYLIQLDQRQMRGAGYKMYGDLLPYFGNDDSQIDVQNLNRLHGFAEGVREDLVNRYTNPRTGVNNFEPNESAGQGPGSGGGTPKSQEEQDIEDEVIKRGWR